MGGRNREPLAIGTIGTAVIAWAVGFTLDKIAEAVTGNSMAYYAYVAAAIGAIAYFTGYQVCSMKSGKALTKDKVRKIASKETNRCINAREASETDIDDAINHIGS